MKVSQKDKLFELLSDMQPHNTPEILEVVYGSEHLGLARVGARIQDLKDEGHSINGWPDLEKPTIYWYQLVKTALGTAVATAVEPVKKVRVIYEPTLRDGRWVAVRKEVLI